MVQTSLIPTVIALSEFFAQNFPHFYWYPNWYSGNPYYFLIGPVVPTILAILNIKYQILNIYLGLIGASFAVGSVGIYLFLRDWGVGRKQSIISGILYLVLPVGIYLLNFQNGLNHIALSLLPFFLLFYRKFLKGRTLYQGASLEIVLSILLGVVLLINVPALLPFVIGAIALIVSENAKDQRISHFVRDDIIIDRVVKTIIIFLLGISIASIWYTPRFWWTLLSNPSLGGIPLFNLFTSVFKLLLNLLPVVFAILVVRWRSFRPKGYLLFATLFFASFILLTLLRFLLDPDFITDWMGFGLEIQFGMAIILGLWIAKFTGNEIKNQKSKIKNTYQNSKLLLISIILLPIIALDYLIIANMFAHQKNDDFQFRIIKLIQENVKNEERVFLSGSSVFWINSILDVNQVRGGVDQVSIHPFWAHGAYQIREGEDERATKSLMSIFGASYILVHNKDSEEFYSDFKHPEKYQNLELLNEEKGDMLYKLNDISIGRTADNKLLKIKQPKGGDDKKAIFSYVSLLKSPVNAVFKKPDILDFSVNIEKNEVISLAITYDKRWKITKGEGKVAKDSFGNMLVLPDKTGNQDFGLSYKLFWYDLGIPIAGSVLLILVLLNYPAISPVIKNRFKKLHFGIHDEEEEY